MWILALTVGGSVVLVVVVLVVVFAVIRKAIDRAAADLASEVIELDSGPVTVTTRMKDFRSPGFYSGGAIRRNPARVVLTKQRLHILQRPQRYGIIDRADLARFAVAVTNGTLHLRSEDPPGATGSIDYRIPVRDTDAWAAALTAAGAKRVDAA